MSFRLGPNRQPTQKKRKSSTAGPFLRNRQCYELIVLTLWRIQFSAVSFVEKGSLLSSEHGFFSNIYTQKRPSLKGKQLSVWGGRKDGLGGFCPRRYIVKKSHDPPVSKADYSNRGDWENVHTADECTSCLA